MKALSRAAHWLFVVFVVAGCASSNVTAYQPYQGKIARPDRIIVYDFVATPSELPPEVAIAGQGATPPPLTAAQLATGRKLGAEIAKDLVAELQTMGLPGIAPLLAALLLPLAGFAIQQAVNASVDALASEVKELREKSQPAPYHASVVIDDDPKTFAVTSQCVLLIRREETREETNVDSSSVQLDQAGLILLFGLEARPGKPRRSFTMPLRYIKLNNAVAVTGKGQPIDLAVAFVGKAAVTDDKGINKVQIFAEQTISIPHLALGSAQRVTKQADPGTSLLALPPEKAERIELIVAVQESGTAVPNAAKAEAELKALGEAVGPALKDQLKTLVATE